MESTTSASAVSVVQCGSVSSFGVLSPEHHSASLMVQPGPRLDNTMDESVEELIRKVNHSENLKLIFPTMYGTMSNLVAEYLQ